MGVGRVDAWDRTTGTEEKDIRPGEMTNLSLILRIHKVERNSQPPHTAMGHLYTMVPKTSILITNSVIK